MFLKSYTKLRLYLGLEGTKKLYFDYSRRKPFAVECHLPFHNPLEIEIARLLVSENELS